MKSQNPIAGRRGMLLVLVLVVITVLLLVGTSFSFWMQADVTTVEGLRARQQARLAAESGLARVMLLLRDKRTNMDNWYNSREAFRRILVWAPDRIGGSESLADQEKIEGQPAWRFSVVATEYEGDRPRMRYGLTDEPSKLNLNTATREQLLTLFGQLRLRDVTAEQLADALMDWRDADDTVTGTFGAESSYYMTLDPPYRCKNKPLETVDELLMVKYFNGRILYGEDYNRNGYLDQNEDDGPEGLFPPDDGDGVLDRGLLPYVTVYSWDTNSANDNKPRININAYKFANADKLPDTVKEVLDPDLIDFLAEVQKRGYKFRSVGELVGLQVYEDGSSNYDAAWKEYNQARKEANAVGKVTESQPAEQEQKTSQAQQGNATTQGSSRGGQQAGGLNKGVQGDSKGQGRQGNPTTQGAGRGRGGRDRGSGTTPRGRNFGQTGEDATRNAGKGDQGNQQGGQRNRQGTGRQPGGPRGRAGQDGRQTDRQAQKDSQGSDQPSSSDGRTTDNLGEDENNQQDQTSRQKDRTRRQRSAPKSSLGQEENMTDTRPVGEESSSTGNEGSKADKTDGGQGSESKTGQQVDQSGQAQQEQKGSQTQQVQKGGQTQQELESGQAGKQTSGKNQPGQQGAANKDTATSAPEGEKVTKGRGTPVVSPVTAEEMAVLMDRLTVSTQWIQVGLINVNTAQPMVLKTIPGLTDEEAQAIASRRGQLGGEDKMTPAWLVSAGVLDPTKFALICNQITARSIQFSVDVIGFADHVGAMQRVEAVVEMQGQLSQVKYYRDITSLGVGYPLEGDQRSEGFEFDDRR